MGRTKLKFKILVSLSTLFFFSFFSSIADDAAVMSKLATALSPTPSTWSTDTDYCHWNGVLCDVYSRVTTIIAAGMSLAGTLPSDLNSLSLLTHLSLWNNSLSGPLPSLANLTFLQFVFLDHNNFTSIPNGCFQGLFSLLYLNLSDNTNLAPWTFPAGLTTSRNLLTLKLENTNIMGTTEVLSSMTHLSQVWLHSNHFTGPIPDLSNCTHLFDLQLQDNQLTGVVPPSLTGLLSLQNVSLDNNMLQGPMPVFGEGVMVTLGGITSFCRDTAGPCDPRVTTLLEIAAAFGYPILLANSWKGNNPCQNWSFIACDEEKIMTVNLAKQNLTGTISPGFANLTDLRNLYLSGNNLTGSIPENLTTLPHLEVVDVSYNNLSGEVPKFSPKVKLTTAGNLLLQSSERGGRSPSPDSGDTPSGSPSQSPAWIAVVLFVFCYCYA